MSVKVLSVTPLLSGVFVNRVFCAYIVMLGWMQKRIQIIKLLIKYPFSSPEPWIDPRLWETLYWRTCAVGSYSQKLAIGTLRRLLTPLVNMNAPITDAFDCSSRKPMRRYFVFGVPQSSSLSQSSEELWGRDRLNTRIV